MNIITNTFNTIKYCLSKKSEPIFNDYKKIFTDYSKICSRSGRIHVKSKKF